LTTEFDTYTENYDGALAKGLAISGENKDYFARSRVAWLSNRLNESHVTPKLVMDFGCGIGSSSTLLLDLLKVESYLGVDQAAKLLDKARQAYGAERRHFMLVGQYSPCEEIDLVFSNGVFHHIPIDDRAAAVDYIYRALRPGGLLALWENNPWNPGTRYVMSRILFDRDAIVLSPLEIRKLLCARGFEILRTDFLFIFPRILRWLRWIEPYVARLPIGAQYMVLGRKR
jgi:SAM-dependent methyltransferase